MDKRTDNLESWTYRDNSLSKTWKSIVYGDVWSWLGLLLSLIAIVGITFCFFNYGIGKTESPLWVTIFAVVIGLGVAMCYIPRGQIVKGILFGTVEGVFVRFFVAAFFPYLAKFNTLGTVKREMTFDFLTMTEVVNDYDNSFQILLFSSLALMCILVALMVVLGCQKASHQLLLMKREGKHINNFKEDLISLINEKFHITLLTLPSIGVIAFSVIPVVVLIFVAFTNYDRQHMPPTELFTWVGLTNFKNLFENSLSISFGYAFRKILSWTIVWAFVATFTCFFGGIVLSMLINSKLTAAPKLWRTLFMICIAVPQFISLMLIRTFFYDHGIANTICANIGLTQLLKDWGLIQTNYIPFLTNANWAKVMIILINFWVGVPYQMLVATGVLMNIPQDIIEASKIDGASGWTQFWKITMPYYWSVTGPSVVTSIVANINNFNVIYLLTDKIYVTTDQAMANSNAKEVDLLVTWLFNLTQSNNNYKMASTIGIIVFVICSAITLLSFGMMTRNDREKAFG